MENDTILNLEKELTGKKPEEIINYISQKYSGRVAFSTSLGLEDQALTDMIVKTGKPVKIFTLDTGRLFPETYDLIHKTNKRYNLNIDIYFPDYKDVEKMTGKKGINLFYESVENRKLCCHIRKIVPLQRALAGSEIWISGLRREQSVTRENNQLVEWDEKFKIIKVNPLLNWSLKEVWDYIKENNVPYNPLHDKNFPSIGCQPCTAPVEKGEDIRKGRWWWEDSSGKECGLHLKK
ncbi:MAG: phosphoadenylyl-sulfate reductase [Bacteroidota bacterium]